MDIKTHTNIHKHTHTHTHTHTHGKLKSPFLETWYRDWKNALRKGKELLQHQGSVTQHNKNCANPEIPNRDILDDIIKLNLWKKKYSGDDAEDTFTQFPVCNFLKTLYKIFGKHLVAAKVN